ETPLDRLFAVDGELQIATLIAEIDQIVQDLCTEDLKNALTLRRDRSYREQLRVVVAQQEALLRMREAVVGYERSDVGDLSLLRSQEFLGGRDVVEQVADGDGRATG